MSQGTPIDLARAFDRVQFLPNRTPDTPESEAARSFAALADYRNGGVYVAHYAGNSEWERHPHGDELVQVLEGETRLFLLENGEEQGHDLAAGQLMVVPANIWHRFETPNGVKVMTVTPQPTDHRVERPE